MEHRKDKKEKSAERKRDRKKHKKRHHDSDGSSSEGEVQAEAPPPPWHRMAFDLVDGINGYGGATPDSRTLLGMASDGSAAVDMSEYTRLVDYLRETFQIHAELRVVLRVEVRTNLRMQACTRSASFAVQLSPVERVRGLSHSSASEASACASEAAAS